MKLHTMILAAALLLAGCGGSASPGPASSSPAPASSSPAPASSAAAPAKPASAAGSGNSAAGVSAAASTAATGASTSAAAASSSAKPSAAASAGGKLEPLRLAFGGAVILQIPLWSAYEGGFFKKYGFDASAPITMSGRTALDALISGQMDLVGAGAYQTALGVGSGAKVRMIAVFSNKEPFTIYASPNITTPQQLKGAKVGTTGPAGESAIAFDLYLKKVGLTTKDIVPITLSTTGDEVPALASGAINAVAFIPPLPPQAASKAHVLENLSQSGITWIPNSFVVPAAAVDQQPDRTARMLQALEEGGAYAAANPEFTKGLVTKYMKVTSAADLDQDFTFYKSLQAKDLAPEQAALDSVMSQVMEDQKDITREKIQPFYSSKILDQLRASGFLAKNGAPAE